LADEAGIDRAKIAVAVVLTSPFVPMLFQGEEWAASTPFQYFADHEDPELARLVSEGRKKEFEAFGWDPASIPDPEKRETFERSKLMWKEVTQGRHAEMLAWCRDLIQLRRSTLSLNDGEPGHTRVTYDSMAMWFSIVRGDTTIYCTLGNECAFQVEPAEVILLASRDGIALEERTLKLPPDTVVITTKAL
jgi:maltooligosyltrehalose trehalohydrolase